MSAFYPNIGNFAQMTGIFLLLAMFLASPCAETSAAEVHTLESDYLTVHYPPQLEQAAFATVRAYPGIVTELEQMLRLPVGFKPTIILQNDRKAFTSQTGGELVLAVAIPDRQLIIIDFTKMTRDQFIFRSTIKHELAHLLLHHHIDNRILPRWFDEGIAQWVSDGISELIHDPGWSVLENAVIRGNLYRFDELSDSFPDGRTETLLAYQQSKNFVEYIIRLYGTTALIDIVHLMRDGVSVERAFSSVLPTGLREIEYRWSEDLRRQTSRLHYVSRNIFQFIFLAAALLVIIAFIRMIIQRRRYSDEPEGEGDEA